MEKDLNLVLLDISEKLKTKDVSAMIFLCGKDLPSGEKENIRDGRRLFSTMKKKGLLSKDNLLFLKELLSRIGRRDILANDLKTTKAEMEEFERSFQHVSRYRSLLYKISVNLDSEEIGKILFLLESKENIKECMMTILTEMEKQRILSEDNLEPLNKLLLNIKRRDLSDKIKMFEAELFLMSESSERRMSDLSLNDQPGLEIYSMNGKHRSYCLIINNINYLNYTRTGAKKDAEFLNNVFTWLGFVVEIHTDLSAEEIYHCLIEFQERDHTERDCFVCCILSNGVSQAVYGTDDEDIPIGRIVSCFSTKNCSTLAGKPKLFFIQASQTRGLRNSYGIMGSDEADEAEENGTTITIPSAADVLIGQSTVDGCNSFRNVIKGSWYIQALCENLIKMVPRGEDILSILTKVNKDVSEMEFQKWGKTIMKQMPYPSYTLRKKFVFPKPAGPFY